ncbi:MAG: type II toxin-antitoxin system prevent-host-death family antitoxin [Calditrichaceae bacterium]|nr:type II toxin-antitoxin system prevent-host-death family antitoxin [Calditrichaceae bacterium]
MKATAKDLRFYSKELLDSANRGEEVIITYRGKPYAKLVPIKHEKKGMVKEEHHLFGIWKDNEEVKDVDEYIEKLRKGRF